MNNFVLACSVLFIKLLDITTIPSICTHRNILYIILGADQTIQTSSLIWIYTVFTGITVTVQIFGVNKVYQRYTNFNWAYQCQNES